jgi:serine acetyltransferase
MSDAAPICGVRPRVVDHLSIGAGATVGMGAIVVSDVAEATSVSGVPTRRIGRSSMKADCIRRACRAERS